MKYKVGDVVENNGWHDLILDVLPNGYIFAAIHDGVCKYVNAKPYDGFEHHADVLITDPNVISEINKLYKIYQMQEVLEK